MEVEQHPIFLSHAGEHKPFVEKLAHALREVGLHLIVNSLFFRVLFYNSLPLGESAMRYKLAVVVPSDGFFTSYGHMAELNSISNPPSVCKILPLFYYIQPDDLKRTSPCFLKWRKTWRGAAHLYPSRVNINEWENATAQLSVLNGVVYDWSCGEDFFVKQAVHRICDIVCPPLCYHGFSSLTGQERLTHEVVSLFEGPTSRCRRAPAIGFYAIGGQGKTTICKLMANHYRYDYAGRCSLIEFPSNDCNEKRMVELCKRALQQLTSMAEDGIVTLHSFDECMQEMKDRLGNHNVFIALDNVGEKSLDYAQRILDVEFNTGSKILVTSRSNQILSILLNYRGLVKPLPSLNGEEARQVFIKSFNRNQAGQQTPAIELEDSDVDDLTKKYQSKGGYHPATVTALAASLGRSGRKSWPLVQKYSESPFLEDSDELVNEVIRRNFESLPKRRRDLLMDVSLIYIPYVKGSFTASSSYDLFDENIGEQQVCFEELLLTSWLSSLHGVEMEIGEIKWHLRELECDGFLEFDDGFASVAVHDLYKDLVTSAAFASGRFVLPMKDRSLLVENIDWEHVERVVWCDDESLHNWSSSEPIPGETFLPELQLLMILHQDCNNIHIVQPNNFRSAPRLRVLDVRYQGSKWSSSQQSGKASLPMTLVPFMHNFLSWCSLRSVSNLELLCPGMVRKLCVLDLSNLTINDPFFLKECVNLEVLSLGFCSVNMISSLDNLTKLKHMSLSDVKKLHSVGRLSRCCSQLQVLEIKGCLELRKIEGLGAVPNLRRLEIMECPVLLLTEEDDMLPESLHALALECVMQRQPNLSGMKTLEHVLLRFERKRPVEAVGIHGLPCLITLELQGKVSRISFISELPRLRRLELADCRELTELNWSSLINLPSLEALVIRDCHDLKKVVGEPHCTIRGLQYLSIQRCRSLSVVDGSDYFFQGGHYPNMERFQALSQWEEDD